MSLLLQLVANGLLLGGAYAIISIGLTLIFGVAALRIWARPKLKNSRRR